MNGVKYYRIKSGLTVNDLYRASGIYPPTIRAMERVSGDNTMYPRNYLALREFFGVPVDELLREDFPELEEPEHNHNRGSATENPDNCLAVYRKRHNLSLRGLGEILGASHECVCQQCSRPTPRAKYVRILADREKMTAEEFYEVYKEVV